VSSSAAEFAGLDLLPTAVVALDADLVVGYANPAAEDLFAIGESALRGQAFLALFAERDDLERSLREATRTHWDYAAQTVSYLRPGHEPLLLSCVATGIELRDFALLVELRPIEQQLRLVREERMVIEQQSSRELLRNLPSAGCAARRSSSSESSSKAPSGALVLGSCANTRR
jgi:two-component system nitrogen regulation sensor histidine kinase GlnL